MPTDPPWPGWPQLPDVDPDADRLDPRGWPGTYAPDIVETDNPVTATLYGPSGEVLIEMHERRRVPFGYQRGEAYES